ncbi:hypothetical protein SprV_0200969800 [Sparganum proliferum]
MKPRDAALARFYGLPKIHKPNVHLRPIVALKGAPTYRLTKWLAKHLNRLADGSEHTAVSSTHFLEKLKGVVIASDEVMVSFDVVSLFTAIPKELAMKVINDPLEKKYDEEGNPFKRKHVTELLDYCLRTYFTFNGQIYEQIQETPMGSQISGYLAEAVMQELEVRVFQYYKPRFWMRYVDDTFVILRRDAKDNFRRELNSVFLQIQFIMEEEKDGVLPFLDVLVFDFALTKEEMKILNTSGRNIRAFIAEIPMFAGLDDNYSTSDASKAQEDGSPFLDIHGPGVMLALSACPSPQNTSFTTPPPQPRTTDLVETSLLPCLLTKTIHFTDNVYPVVMRSRIVLIDHY